MPYTTVMMWLHACKWKNPCFSLSLMLNTYHLTTVCKWGIITASQMTSYSSYKVRHTVDVKPDIQTVDVKSDIQTVDVKSDKYSLKIKSD